MCVGAYSVSGHSQSGHAQGTKAEVWLCVLKDKTMVSLRKALWFSSLRSPMFSAGTCPCLLALGASEPFTFANSVCPHIPLYLAQQEGLRFTETSD